MTWLESIYLWNIVKGMAITFSHLFKRRPTISYPEQTRSFSKVFRGLHVLNRDEEGRERCTACGHCAQVCRMDVRLAGDPECISCGDCVSSCPEKAITFRGLKKNKADLVEAKK